MSSNTKKSAAKKVRINYSTFGSPMPGRQFTRGAYRYGFNGKENDPEAVGTGKGTQDYGMRIYNPSLGKFLSVDPLTSQFAYYSPFHFAGNSPIKNIDLDGGEPLGKSEYNVAYPDQTEVNSVAIIAITTKIVIQGTGALPPNTTIRDVYDVPYTTQTRNEPGGAPFSNRVFQAEQTLIFKEDYRKGNEVRYKLYQATPTIYGTVSPPPTFTGPPVPSLSTNAGISGRINSIAIDNSLKQFHHDVKDFGVDPEKARIVQVDVYLEIGTRDKVNNSNSITAAYKTKIIGNLKKNYGDDVKINFTSTTGDDPATFIRYSTTIRPTK